MGPTAATPFACTVLGGQQEDGVFPEMGSVPRFLMTGPEGFPWDNTPSSGQPQVTGGCIKWGIQGHPTGLNNGLPHVTSIPDAQLLLHYLKRVFLPEAEQAEVFETRSVLQNPNNSL